MRRRCTVLALASLLVLAAWAPSAGAVTTGTLHALLTKLHSRVGSAAGAYVLDEGSGAVLFSHRPDLALAPASNEKLFVTATALLRFGPTDTLQTTVAT